MKNEIVKFQKECYLNYIPSIRENVPGFPEEYYFPDGNPIKPVLPVQTIQNGIMVIGAFPSARFERRNGMLIPIANNLSPFGEETYFDGRETRFQASRESLNKNYFPQLSLIPQNIWITDIVKIYLFPEKHLKNCRQIAPNRVFINTHKLFKKIAQASMLWMANEIKLCNPSLIITLGEIPARVILGDYKTENKILLDGNIKIVNFIKNYKISCLAHPEIRRRNKEWDYFTEKAIKRLSDNLYKGGV